VTRVRLSGAGGLPGRTACAYLVGRERVVVVDPGDPSGQAAAAILGEVAALGGRIAAVALTSPEPGHTAGVTALALPADTPVLAGAGVGAEVARGVRTLGDGEWVTEGDLPMQVLATPGTDAAHLAYDIPGAGVGAVLTGDLDGLGTGTAMPGRLDAPGLARSRWRLDSLGSRRRLGAHD
jgi:glyoxylase-like metal-dependent hydrolase (beta-lactamase superfamily II)